MNIKEEGDIALYIHIPFCIKKCYYCDFNSYPLHGEDVYGYLDALKSEIKEKALLLRKEQRKVSTIYIGGGTPTCLSGEELGGILSLCKEGFSLTCDAEITVEANPGTLSEDKLILLLSGGVNRLSIGVQTFNDELLKRIGRIHKTADIVSNYNLARNVGFNNISMDLIFGLPGQTLHEWMETLHMAVYMKPDHISIYNLVIEEGSKFYEDLKKGEIAPLEEELDLEMYTKAREELKGAGYEQYEISNFARAGKECRHNIVYWRNGEYLGLGPGAHSYFKGTRFSNFRSIPQYIRGVLSGSPVEEREIIDEVVSMWETIFLGLRLTKEGVDLVRFKERFGRNLKEVYGRQLEYLQGQNLISLTNDHLILTPKGVTLANRVFVEFAP
jgi:oxygen-independent coproporphyrinogen-3 oxidase